MCCARLWRASRPGKSKRKVAIFEMCGEMASSEEREEPISSSTDEEDGASLISHEEPQDLERVTLPWKQLAPLCVLQGRCCSCCCLMV